MRGSNPKVVQMLSKPQRRAPNVHKMSTEHANARFPGPMSCKNLTSERRHFQNDANTTEVHGFVSHRNKGFQFFFDALYFLIPTGCFFSALFSKYIALFFFCILQLGHDALEIVTQPVASHHVFASAQTKNSISCGVEILWA